MKVKIRTKRIGKYRLNKIVSLVFEKRDYFKAGLFEWWACIEGRENGVKYPMGYGDTKIQARDEFIKDFEKNPHLVKDLIVEYETTNNKS